MTKNIFLSIAVVLMLGGCGTDPGERALSGAGIGAGVGAIGSSVVGGSILGGAAVGGAVGAATGALTDKDDINLDR